MHEFWCRLFESDVEVYVGIQNVNISLWWALMIISFSMIKFWGNECVCYVFHDIGNLNYRFKDSFMIRISYSSQFIIPLFISEDSGSFWQLVQIGNLSWDHVSQPTSPLYLALRLCVLAYNSKLGLVIFLFFVPKTLYLVVHIVIVILIMIFPILGFPHIYLVFMCLVFIVSSFIVFGWINIIVFLKKNYDFLKSDSHPSQSYGVFNNILVQSDPYLPTLIESMASHYFLVFILILLRYIPFFIGAYIKYTLLPNYLGCTCLSLSLNYGTPMTPLAFLALYPYHLEV